MPITTAVKVALNSINSPRLVINADHVIEYANEAFVQQFGNNDCHGKPCHAVIFEREKPCHEYGFHCPLHEVQISLKPATSRQTLIDTAGSHHWELEVSPVLGTDGRPQFYIEAIERRANFVTPLSGQGIVAKSESTQAVLNRIKKLSLFKMPVLLIGPPGSGKREFARNVHEISVHASHDFITIDCQNLTPEKLHHHLQLRSSKKFEEQGGTLYFSDISQLSKHMQSELSQSLKTGTWVYKRGHDTEKVYTNLRFIFASCMSVIELEIVANLSLEFLFKISSCTLTVPGLDQRKEDIPELIEMILNHLKKIGICVEITPSAIEALKNKKKWRAHVTELYNIILRAMTTQDKPEIGSTDLVTPSFVPEVFSSDEVRIKNMIRNWKGSKRELATRLGIHVRTLYRKIESMNNSASLEEE